jgi:excinuclease ABC subunit C
METPQETLALLPHQPGIYLYKDKTGQILYVGKAKDLKKRVSQYFQKEVEGKTSILVSQIHSIETIKTDSEFDALLLEAKLIRTHLPKFNIIARDDKSPLYIVITMDEELPRILWLRKTALEGYPKATLFGPFQSGKMVRTILRQIRAIVPYCSAKVRDGKPCFYTHLGLCGPCPSAVSKMENSSERQILVRTYRNNIRKIISILSGKSLVLLHDMEKEMQQFAKKEEFENAQNMKLKVTSLHELLARHFDPHVYMQNETFAQDIRVEEALALKDALQNVYPNMEPIERVECIDISNTMGKHATGSLVVLINGIPSTGEYRRFKIRLKDAPNDFAMVAEVLKRRLKHVEWDYPELLVIDGGKGQVGAAKKILEDMNISIPLIGLAKRFEEIIVPHNEGWKVIKLPISHKGLHLLQRIRDESHRFALRYHRLLRSRAFLPKI